MVNGKARDTSALGRFWARALGWTVFSDRPGATAAGPPGFTWPAPGALCLDFIGVPDPAAGRGRLHLDLATTSAAHQTELVADLLRHGATRADVGQGEVPWAVLADPEGNVFCVLEPRDVYRDTGPIAAIVVDCADPRALGRFWSQALGWAVHESSADLTRLRSADGTGPYLEFLRSSGTRSAFHLDLLPYPREGRKVELSRLHALGATAADVGQGDVAWTVLADPEGNVFCVLAD
ncbi:VOC family protein [Actinoplanes sichuanensis]|nr:VOC family protein [Actinoplanes sichuanensis]